MTTALTFLGAAETVTGSRYPQRKPSVEAQVCPLCGSPVDVAEAAPIFTYLGQTQRFCCPACRDRFARTPDRFVVQLAHEETCHLDHPCPQQSTRSGDRLG